MRALRTLPLVLLAGCFDPGNAPSCTIQCSTDADCTEGLTCGAGGLCTSGENCIEPDTCMANEFIACVDDMARSCNAAGDGTTDAACGAPGCNMAERRCNTCIPDQVSCSSDMMAVEQCMPDGSAKMRIDQCAAGCVPGAAPVAPHCAYISPAWIPDVCDTVAAMDTYMPNASATITTTLDTNCTGGVITQPAGPPICVVRAKSITIPNNITLTLSGTRSIAFVADTLVDVIGTLDAGAEGRTSGPGGGFRVSGTAASTTGAGGGAGFGGAGANGSATASGNGSQGGPVLDPITLSYFGGGARAGSGTGIFDPGGGGGGGAVMLVACRGEVKVSGVIDAGGGGGGGQYDTVLGGGISQSRPAAGGGSGGYVVIQGLTVTVSGQIYANGGGGGGGNTVDDGPNTSGGDGLRSTSQSSGGAAGGAGGLGGRGGALGANALSGGPTTAGSSAGGGGGGVGVLQIYTPMGVAPVTTGATVSPGFTAKKNSMLR